MDISKHFADISDTSTSNGMSDDFPCRCETCEEEFPDQRNLVYHRRTEHGDSQPQCDKCLKIFTRGDNLKRHIEARACRPPKRKGTGETAPGSKRKRLSPSSSPARQAFDRRLFDEFLTNDDGYLDLKEFLISKKESFVDMISKELGDYDLKVNVQVWCNHEKALNNEIVTENQCFKTKNTVILKTTKIGDIYDNFVEKMLAESVDFLAKGSGWSLVEIKALEVRVSKYNPLRGSSHLALPPKIKAKRAVINVRNNDDECFKWAILSALHPVEVHSDRVSSYKKYSEELDFTGISFPVMFEDIPVFEKRNDISINVYEYTDTFEVHPLLMTTEVRDRHLDLLYLETEKNSHYCWIKDLSRLVSMQISKHKAAKHICRRCLQHFGTNPLLLKHKEKCIQHDAPAAKMPDVDNNVVSFKNVERTQKVPFVIYADFECYTTPVANCEPTPNDSFTNVYQKHTPMSFCVYIVCSNKFYKEPFVYRGQDAAKVFIEHLKQEAKEIEKIYSKPVPMTKLNAKELLRYNDATECYLCFGKFSKKKPKVRDHCHFTGVYRGPACDDCNMKCWAPRFIPVFLHNLTNYDLHLFIKEFGCDDGSIDVIPESEEKYISISKTLPNQSEDSKPVKRAMKLRFLDSFRFMTSSLDALIKILSKDQFLHMRRHFPSDKVDLLLRKGVFPYDYMTDESKCDDTCLPEIEHFRSELNECDISEDDYRHSQEVWNTFDIKSMGGYSDLYVKTDVLLLADIFENFRSLCLKTYDLDPAWYYTGPSLSWDAMLRKTKVEIEIFTEYEMLLFVEKGIRGGISQCSHRYAKANNKYMGDYNPKEDSTYLLYLDANNLYGWAMSQYLPLNNFKWSSIDVNVMDIPDDSPIGYILEVDLEYPAELHDSHSDLPLAPENVVPPGCSEKRLLTTLHSKRNYVIHYRNLKQCIQKGLKLTKIHKVLEFNQSRWLEPYIRLNTVCRSASKSDFEKNFYKLMNNSVFGKTMENVRRYVNIRLCSDARKAEKLIAKPNFKSRTIFSENLVAIHLHKTSNMFNKPIIVGMSVLDISKELMYDFHYNFMKNKYGDNIRLLYTDTDSLIYSIQTEDVYRDIKENIDRFDTSDYPENNKFGIPLRNKKVLGKMKDECNGEIMTEFIGLKSKMYTYRGPNIKEVKKLKGVKRTCVENRITFDDYYKCLFKEEKTYTTMNQIQSQKHELYSVKKNKLALSYHDDKRHVLDDKKSTLAHGHFRVLQNDARFS